MIHTERMKSNKIEYYICANIIYFIAKFQKVVSKTKSIYEPLLFSEYAVHLDLCFHDMAGRNSHMSSISINSEEMSLLTAESIFLCLTLHPVILAIFTR